MTAVSTVMKAKNDHSLTRRQRPGHDGRRSRHEHHLEEPVGHYRVAALHHRRLGILLAVQKGKLVRRRAVEELERADPARDVHVHQVVAEEVVGGGRRWSRADVLQADHRGVLRAHGSGFQHGESRAHPHHQCAPDEERERVEHELRLAGNLGRGASRRQQKDRGRESLPPRRHAAAVSLVDW